MENDIYFSYDEINQIIKEYYQKKYKDIEVESNIYKGTESHRSSEWDDDRYYTVNCLAGYLCIIKKTTAFGQEKVIKENTTMCSTELKEFIKGILDKELDEEGNNLEVNYISVLEKGIQVSLSVKKSKDLNENIFVKEMKPF